MFTGYPSVRRSDVNQPAPQPRLAVSTRLAIALQLILVAAVVVSVLLGQWLMAVATLGIVLLTLVPSVLGRRFGFFIPPEFELLAILFIFASLFLGEIRGYYTRFWWWDALLHVGSGFLLGLLGFLLVYALNQRSVADLGLRPSFVAIFAFAFSVALGTLWEIFEFGMDQLFGLNMQKSGLVDTMWDLIVDTVGAAAVALIGYGHLKRMDVDSFLVRWIERLPAEEGAGWEKGEVREGENG